MKKFIIVLFSIILLIALVVFGYFYSVWAKGRNQEEAVIDLAYKKVPSLAKVDDIDYFTGDKQFYFVFGTTKNEIPVLIWMNKDETNTLYLFDYVTKDEIKKKGLEIAPQIEIKRINAGINNENELIYEVLYEDTDGRLGYQFFYLRTGEFITMYKLGKVRD